MKTCSKCRESKPATKEFFSPDSRNRDGLYSLCKPCAAIKVRLYKEAHRAQTMLGYYRRGDTKRSLSNDLTEAFIEDTTQGPCAYCGTTEDARGLDRLDNSRGHLKTNVVPCCAICNTARNDNFTPEEFKLIGAAIAQIRKQRNESRTSESEG